MLLPTESHQNSIVTVTFKITLSGGGPKSYGTDGNSEKLTQSL